MTPIYTVQHGDTLSRIAKEHNMSVNDLARINNISDPNKIKVNQVLVFEEKNPQKKVTQKEEMFVPVTSNENSVGLDTVEFSRGETAKQSDYSPLAYAAGGAAIYGVVNKAMPYVKKGGQKALEAGKKMAQKGVETGKSAANTVTQKSKKIAKTVTKKYNKTKKSTVQTFKRSDRILNGKRVKIKGTPIKLSKYGKVLGKAATPVNIVVSAYQIGEAYGTGGTKAAAKQTVKCSAGIAGGWAGAKLGAAIGTAICPGIGTAVGGFIGGIGGYLLGEKLADSAMS